MKLLTIISLFVALAVTGFAQPTSIVVTVNFTPGVGNPSTTEHVVQEKNASGVWVDTIAKGANTNILSYTRTATPGQRITVRVVSRLPGDLESTSEPSNEATAVAPLVGPANAILNLKR